MSLNTLYLFSNVRITPDYSVVHDMDPDTWHDFLMGWLDPMPVGADHEIVYSNNLKLNYYRMPDTLRIEGNYDKLKNATYGFLQDGMYNDQQPAKTSFKYIFFWVKDVRLITQRTNDHTEGGQTVFDDVVELELEMDVWSTYGVSSFELYDSFVERRHMKRWNAVTQAGVTTYKPIYYPNASQGVEGAYTVEDTEDLTAPLTFPEDPNGTYDPRFIVVFALDSSGKSKIYIGVDVLDRFGEPIPVYHTYSSVKIFGVQDILDGSFFGNTGAGASPENLTADKVQSITVVPVIAGLTESLRLNFAGGVFYFTFNEVYPPFAQTFSLGHGSAIGWVTLNFGMQNLGNMMLAHYSTPTVIEPDHDRPSYGEYVDYHEPMMYMSPARVRKAVTAFGGEVFTIPDIAAFKSTFTLQNIFDMNSAITYVFAGSDIMEANAIGALGVLEAATLPIYNSAWRSYEAINKVGDEIAYNAKQMQTFANGAAGTASNAIMGGFVGNIPGAVMGAITGIVSTGTGLYGNAEELRAKQVTIKNSPCNVKSGGSGLGAYVKGLTDVFYMTLKMDDQSMEKLRFMYYWYGYIVNRMFKGTVDLYTRHAFDFIKTNGAKIRGSLTAGAARQIAAIFDNGVTIYHGPNGYMRIGSGQMYENDEVE